MPEHSSPELSPAEQIAKLGQFSMRSQRDDDMHIISLSGEFDLASADDVERELVRVEATNAA
ncbi:MAG: hypothetical protein WKF48_08765 [Solirubrobacteraceae bacterium]